MSRTVPNPLALLAFSALCVIGALVLLMTGHPAPDWLVALCGAGVLGGAAVMTPGLQTVERLVGPRQLPPLPAAPAAPATAGLSAADIEAAP